MALLGPCCEILETLELVLAFGQGSNTPQKPPECVDKPKALGKTWPSGYDNY